MQQIQQVVAVTAEARRPVVASLDDVRGDAGRHEARLPGHGTENGDGRSRLT